LLRYILLWRFVLSGRDFDDIVVGSLEAVLVIAVFVDVENGLLDNVDIGNSVVFVDKVEVDNMLPLDSKSNLVEVYTDFLDFEGIIGIVGLLNIFCLSLELYSSLLYTLLCHS